MVWFICKVCIWHMCTFVSENLTVKGLNTKYLIVGIDPKTMAPTIYAPLKSSLGYKLCKN